MQAEARRLYEQGLTRYAAHDFARAIEFFEAGHAIDPRREFLFAEAQAFRLDGDCPHATSLYQRFLATRPPAIQIEATQLGLARCAATAASAIATPLVPAPARAAGARATSMAAMPAPSILPTASPSPSPAPSPSTSRRLLRDPWTTGTIAAGVLALGTGAAFWVAAEQAHAQAQSTGTATYDEFASASRHFEQRRGIAVIALSVGTVLVLCGSGRAWWVAEHDAALPRATLSFDGRRLLWSAVY
jgi:hypothetical protein